MAGLPVVSYAGDRSIFGRLESGMLSIYLSI